MGKTSTEVKRTPLNHFEISFLMQVLSLDVVNIDANFGGQISVGVGGQTLVQKMDKCQMGEGEIGQFLSELELETNLHLKKDSLCLVENSVCLNMTCT